ncbi:hypothetical protein EDB81DRAFT_770941 [Dactylonectria macrodidyma]|uniref:Uncharacterized protein n=1 Tax=Dactylonectria macrodidyma TaxID=307937 RepID=A0A9P9FSA9_9HYPO|nr:hypothetical protein EDB81DRAFT_770941 [Dactylonectria macrodidyma]
MQVQPIRASGNDSSVAKSGPRAEEADGCLDTHHLPLPNASAFDTLYGQDKKARQAAPHPHFLQPIRELPPRRKVVWVWTCCNCGNGGMKISVDPCPYCRIPRCPNCSTRKLTIRAANGASESEGPSDD